MSAQLPLLKMRLVNCGAGKEPSSQHQPQLGCFAKNTPALGSSPPGPLRDDTSHVPDDHFRKQQLQKCRQQQGEPSTRKEMMEQCSLDCDIMDLQISPRPTSVCMPLGSSVTSFIWRMEVVLTNWCSIFLRRNLIK